MGRQTIWDGRGLPEIGDDVLYDTASSGLLKGTVVKFEVMRKWPTVKDHDPFTWRIEVHMVGKNARGETYPQMRFLEEVFPLTHLASRSE